jgi:hypothetical protein
MDEVESETLSHVIEVLASAWREHGAGCEIERDAPWGTRWDGNNWKVEPRSQGVKAVLHPLDLVFLLHQPRTSDRFGALAVIFRVSRESAVGIFRGISRMPIAATDAEGMFGRRVGVHADAVVFPMLI